MRSVGIAGASGYTGGELLRLLLRHPEVEVACATSRRHAGRKLHTVHPHLRGLSELEFSGTTEGLEECDLVFCATPHGVSMELVPELVEVGLRVIDLSGDFRFEQPEVYERYYRRVHRAPELRGVYGLPELHRDKIRHARLVANPGCYPTAIILALVPLLKAGIVEDFIVADAKSGVSGAGAEPKKSTHFPETQESVLPYRITSHQHLPEIEQELSKYAGSIRLSFVPHLVPVIRGLTSTHHCTLKQEIGEHEVREVFRRFYGGEPFVRVLEVGEIPRLSAVRGTNYIDIGGFGVDAERRRLVVVSAIDNLCKGASGQAVQNMNIMLGLDERLGLELIAPHP